MNESTEIEFFIAMNEHGDWALHYEEEAVVTDLSEQYGAKAIRVVKWKVKMKPPEIEEVEISVPDNVSHVGREGGTLNGLEAGE